MNDVRRPVPQTATEPRGFRAFATKPHDGDSFWMMCDTAGGQRWEPELRLLDVHAPELDQPGGPETTDIVNHWLGTVAAGVPRRRWPFWVETVLTKTYEPDMKTTLARYLATVFPFEQREPESSLNWLVRSYLAGHPEWPSGQ